MIATPSQILSLELVRAQDIVAEAAALALTMFNQRDSLAVRSKHPQDFVSAADEAVETLIRQRLAEAFPDDAVLGEEGAGDAVNEQQNCWVIDPIDGTSNFLRGVPLWGVSLGQVRNGQARIGVVALPVLQWLAAAQRGEGLYLTGQRHVRQASGAGVRLVSVGDSDVDLDVSLSMTRALRHAGWVVESYRCTSLGLTMSALGQLDGHLQRYVQAWDIAGGLVLCAEAGLEVQHGPLNGRPTWVRAGLQEIHPIVSPYWGDIEGGDISRWHQRLPPGCGARIGQAWACSDATAWAGERC